MKLIAVNRTQVYRAVIDMLRSKSDNEKWSVELKRYRRLRTLKQNSFEHLLYDVMAHDLDMAASHIKTSVKEQGGPFLRDPLHPDKLIPKPSSECNIEDLGVRIEYAFRLWNEFTETEAPLEFITEWEEIKRREKENEETRN